MEGLEVRIESEKDFVSVLYFIASSATYVYRKILWKKNQLPVNW